MRVKFLFWNIRQAQGSRLGACLTRLAGQDLNAFVLFAINLRDRVMATDDADLWPDDLVVDVLSPTMILNEQAEALTKRTQGIVRGEILSDHIGKFKQLSFDLVAPAAGMRQRILNVRFAPDLPYPAVLLAEPLYYKSAIGWPHAQSAPASTWDLLNDEVYLSDCPISGRHAAL